MSNGEYLGHVVHWEFAPGYEVAYQDLRNGLHTAGFDPDVARAMLPRSAFSRACRRLAADKIVRLCEKKPEYVSFQFTREVRLPGELAYDKEAVVYLDVKTNAVTCKESPALADAAEKLLGEIVNKRTAADVNRLVKALMERTCDIFPVKARSGVYLVPAAKAAAADQVRRLVEGLGGSWGSMAVPRGDRQTERSVRDTIRVGLAKLVADHEAAIAAMDADVGERGIEGAVKRIQETKLKCEAYREGLQAEVDGFGERLDALKQKLALAVEQRLAAVA